VETVPAPVQRSADPHPDRRRGDFHRRGSVGMDGQPDHLHRRHAECHSRRLSGIQCREVAGCIEEDERAQRQGVPQRRAADHSLPGTGHRRYRRAGSRGLCSQRRPHHRLLQSAGRRVGSDR